MSDGMYRPELNISNYVSKFREMDPKTEDLIVDGCDLKNGMRVLVAGSMFREDTSWVDAPPSDYRLDRAKETNRWCTVSHLTYSGDIVSFVATYDDGTKRKRTYHCRHAWFVKLDSIPKTLAETSEETLPTPSEPMCEPRCEHARDEHCLVRECHNYAGRCSELS